MIEYRIRPVTRYVVTRFEQSEPNEHGVCSGGCDALGEFNNADTAYSVAYALCKLEHDKSGEEPGSMNFVYPDSPAAVFGETA
jgi:hypothetical protein